MATRSTYHEVIVPDGALDQRDEREPWRRSFKETIMDQSNQNWALRVCYRPLPRAALDILGRTKPIAHPTGLKIQSEPIDSQRVVEECHEMLDSLKSLILWNKDEWRRVTFMLRSLPERAQASHVANLLENFVDAKQLERLVICGLQSTAETNFGPRLREILEGCPQFTSLTLENIAFDPINANELLQGIRVIANSAESDHCFFNELSLRQCVGVGSDFLSAVASLPRTALKQLTLRNMNLTTECLPALTTILNEQQRLEELDLRYNAEIFVMTSVDDENSTNAKLASDAFLHALQQNGTISHLAIDLDLQEFGPPSTSLFAKLFNVLSSVSRPLKICVNGIEASVDFQPEKHVVLASPRLATFDAYGMKELAFRLTNDLLYLLFHLEGDSPGIQQGSDPVHVVKLHHMEIDHDDCSLMCDMLEFVNLNGFCVEFSRISPEPLLAQVHGNFLETLHLIGCELDDHIIEHTFQDLANGDAENAVAGLAPLTLRHLNLEHNELTARSLRYLTAIAQQNQNLKSFLIADNLDLFCGPDSTRDQLLKFAKMVQSHASLQKLSMSRGRQRALGDWEFDEWTEAVNVLFRFLAESKNQPQSDQKSRHSLSELDLLGSRWWDAYVHVGNWTRDLRHLESLRYCRVGVHHFDPNFNSLVSDLYWNTSLTDFRCFEIDDWPQVKSVLQRNKWLENVHNGINSTAHLPPAVWPLALEKMSASEDASAAYLFMCGYMPQSFNNTK